MILLIVYATTAIAISFLCSVMEAALLSIVPSYIAQIEETNPKLFRQISLLKAKIDRPLAAILSLNTVAHTVGAAAVRAWLLHSGCDGAARPHRPAHAVSGTGSDDL